MTEADFHVYDMAVLERVVELLAKWKAEPPELQREAGPEDLQVLINACRVEIAHGQVVGTTPNGILDVVTARLRQIGKAAPHLTVPDEVWLWLTPDLLTDGIWRLAIKLADRINWMRVAAVPYAVRTAAGAHVLAGILPDWHRRTLKEWFTIRHPVLNQVFILEQPGELRAALHIRITQELGIDGLGEDQQTVWSGQRGFSTPFYRAEFGDDTTDLLYAAWWQEVLNAGRRRTISRRQVAAPLLRTWQPGDARIQWCSQAEPAGTEPTEVDGAIIYTGIRAAERPVPGDWFHSPATLRWWRIVQVDHMPPAGADGWHCGFQPARAPRREPRRMQFAA